MGCRDEECGLKQDYKAAGLQGAVRVEGNICCAAAVNFTL
jgi:hypothetical protein